MNSVNHVEAAATAAGDVFVNMDRMIIKRWELILCLAFSAI